MNILNPLFNSHSREVDGVFHRIRLVPVLWEKRHISEICDEAYWGRFNDLSFVDLALNPPVIIGTTETEEEDNEIRFSFYTAAGEPLEAIRFVSRIAVRFPTIDVWHDYEDSPRELFGRIWYRNSSLYKECHLTQLPGFLRGV